MGADVIQHQRSRRKRASAWSWTTRHFGLLAVALIGVFAASWLAPGAVTRPAPVATPVAIPVVQPPHAAPAPPEVDVRADLVRATPIRAERERRAPTGVPLDAATNPLVDDFEILSAAELDGISQARD